MAANQYKRGELFRRYHLQNIDKRSVIEESSEEVDGALVESDNQADLPVLDEAEVVSVKATKRKASSDENIAESKSARKLSKKHRKSGHGLLNGLIFSSNISRNIRLLVTSMGKILNRTFRPCTPRFPMLGGCDEFGLESPTEPGKALKEMTSEEYQDYKKRLDKEHVLIKKGYDRVKETIRNVRQDFRAAVNKGILNLTPASRGCM